MSAWDCSDNAQLPLTFRRVGGGLCIRKSFLVVFHREPSMSVRKEVVCIRFGFQICQQTFQFLGKWVVIGFFYKISSSLPNSSSAEFLRDGSSYVGG